MAPPVAVPLALLALLGAASPALAPSAGAQSPSGFGWTVPDDLPSRTEDVQAGLERIADAESLDEARRTHRGIAPDLARLASHAVDLAERAGELLGTYRMELDARLAAGNLSDARSIAQAAANLLADEIQPRVDRWAGNRTVVAPGPLRWSDGDLVVAIVLANPPTQGLGALDVELRFESARPTGASVATGRGDATVDRDNRTARVASFSAQALANLEGDRAQRLVLGRVQLEELEPGDRVNATVRVHELVTSGGEEILALGLTGSATVPSTPSGFDLGTWWPLAALGAGAAGVWGIVRRLEV